jgi:carboxypeptidase family protein
MDQVYLKNWYFRLLLDSAGKARWNFRMKLLGAFLLLASMLFGQVIEGTVVDSVSGEAIGGASVQIENSGKAPYQTTSDAQGAFRIEGVADGTYTAIAFKNGFLTVQDDVARRPFHVVAGLDPIQLRLSLIPQGRISGRVLDGDNQPVAGADVSLLQGTGAGQSGLTDADGSFSFDVAAGSYLLSARPPVKLAAPPPVGDQHYAWTKTWFPGVTETSAAQKILIRPGVELMGQDIKLRAVNAYSIRGWIRDGNGGPASKVAIQLSRAEDYQHAERTTVSGNDGGFEFADISDGDWRLSSELSGKDFVWRAFASVIVTGRDADDVELRLNAPFSLPVEFFLETSDSTVKILGSVVLAPEWGGASPASKRNKDGTFKIDGLYPGRYRVNALPSAQSGYYLASITLGDQDILGKLVEFSPDSAHLRVVYRSDGGTLRGTVENCGNATIAIAQRNVPSVRFAHCTEGGHFEIPNLRPASYYAFAFDKLEANTSNFLSSLPSLINKAVTVEINAGQVSNIELKITTPF